MSEKDRLLESNYDGIQEYDNDLPRWWVYLFYLTIIFGGCYIVYFHIYPGVNTKEELAQTMKQFEQTRVAAHPAEQEMSERELIALVDQSVVVNQGKEVFNARCVACHGPAGGGLVGPNLTDKFWIHGGQITDIHHTITKGVPEKGMLAWGSILPESEINAVTAYIWTLRNTNVPNGKAAEGTPIE